MTPHGILVLTGPPCAGKSSVGTALISGPFSAHGIYVEIDSLFDLLLPQSDRNRHDRMLAYDAAHVLARLLFARGKTPMLECTYSRSEQRASLITAIAGIPEAPLWIVELAVSPGEAVQRFRRREQDTDLDERLVRERVESFPYCDDALQLDSAAATPDALAARIETWLASGPPPVDGDRWATAGKGWDA